MAESNGGSRFGNEMVKHIGLLWSVFKRIYGGQHPVQTSKGFDLAGFRVMPEKKKKKKKKKTLFGYAFFHLYLEHVL
jgi:hypothetical protein